MPCKQVAQTQQPGLGRRCVTLNLGQQEWGRQPICTNMGGHSSASCTLKK
ncbi:hypothetical protein SESBI_00715 [Sesbania bispinosa]|nr:hypothetical protein SESBI_00715 [Sesbania bispinosa]